MKKINFTILISIAIMLLGSSPMVKAQYFSDLGDTYKKIDGSEYFESNGKKYYFDSDKEMFVEGNNEYEDIHYSYVDPYFRKDKVVYQHEKGTYNDGYADRPFVVPFIKDGDVTHKLNTDFEVYNSSKYYSGFNGTALYINGGYYFQFENFKVKHSNNTYTQTYKGVFYWDGDEDLMFLEGTEYSNVSSNFYDEIEVGKIYKEKLFFQIGTEFCYYPKNPNGKGMDISDAPRRVIFENDEDNTNFRFLRTLDENDDHMTLLFANDNEYMVGTLTTKDSINISTSGTPYYVYTMKKIATMEPLSDMTSFRVSQELNLTDKDVVCLKRPWEQYNSVRILDIKTNTVKDVEIPKTFGDKDLATILIHRVKNDKLYFSIKGVSYSMPFIYNSIFTYDGDEVKEFTRTGRTVNAYQDKQILNCEWNNSLYFHFKAENCESGLFRLDADTLMPMTGVRNDRYLEEMTFENLGNSTIFAGRYKVGFVGALELITTTGNHCPETQDSLKIEALEGSTFQWYKNEVEIEGETSEKFVFTYSENIDKYYVAVSNNGSVQNSGIYEAYPNTSEVPELTDNNKVTNNCVQLDGSIQIGVKNSFFDSIHWYLNEKIIDIDNNSDYDDTYPTNLKVNLNKNSVGTYYAIVYKGVCRASVQTQNFELDTIGAPTINYDNLIDRKACENQEFKLNISASDPGNDGMNYSLKFATEKENTNYSSVQSSNYSTELEYIIPQFKQENIGYYFVETLGKCYNVNSDTLKVDMGYMYEITDMPKAITDCPETSQELKVEATSQGNLSYQWYKNNNIVEGETQNVYSIASLNVSDAGKYKVHVIGECNDEYTNEVDVKVYNYEITAQPVAIADCPGTKQELKVEATTNGTISYQWYKNNETIEGATQNIYNIESLKNDHLGDYKVLVKADCAEEYSTEIAIEVYKETNILTQPVDVEVNQGEAAKFTVEAEGQGTISYQWMFNDANIENETNAELSLTNTSKSDEGNYNVEVIATCGTKTSEVASLSIQTTGLINIAAEDLKVYPNPVQNNLYIDTELEIVSLKLRSIIGNTVLSLDKISGNQINMSSYKTGIYLLTIKTNNGEATFRIIKK